LQSHPKTLASLRLYSANKNMKFFCKRSTKTTSDMKTKRSSVVGVDTPFTKEPEVQKLRNLSLARFKEKAFLGAGTFGRVKLVQDMETKRHCALKILKKAQIVEQDQVDHIKNEKRILEKLSHPFIVSILGTFQNEKHIYMVLEYVPGGELFSILRRRGKLTNAEAQFYAGQVVLALEYLHSNNVVYRDLKPENILLTLDGYIKIADFGFAKEVKDRTFSICGTPSYQAPEVIQSRGHSKGVDWWALGVVLFEMLAGYAPFREEPGFPVNQQILCGEIKFPRSFSKDAKDLIKQLLNPDTTKRIGCGKSGAAEIKSHPWFKDMDWDALYNKKMTPFFVPHVSSEDDTSNFDEFTESGGNDDPTDAVDESVFADF
jgi:protein kinase X